MAYPSRKRKSSPRVTGRGALGAMRTTKRYKKSKKSMPARSMKARLNHLLKGQTKQTAIDLYMPDALIAVATDVYARCLTAPATVNVAPSANGVCVGDEDESLINSFHLKGQYELVLKREINDLIGGSDSSLVGSRVGVRHLYVWWNRAPELASAAGTLPLITSILEPADSRGSYFNSHFLEKNVTDKRFTVLKDIKHYMSAGSGPMAITDIDEYIAINKVQKYKKPCTEAVPGGHYDSDVQNGQVTTGLPVLYILPESSSWAINTYNGSGAGLLYANHLNGRLTYTQ